MRTKINLLYSNWYEGNAGSWRLPNGLTRAEVEHFQKILKEWEEDDSGIEYLNEKHNPNIRHLENAGFRPWVKIGPFEDAASSKAFEFVYHKLEDIKDDVIYFYVIELLNPDGFYRTISKIPKEVIDLINQDRCFVIYDYEHEGWWDPYFFNRFYFRVLSVDEGKREDIKLENIYFLHGDLKVKDMMSEGVQINFVPITHFLDVQSLSFHSMKIRKEKMKTEFGYYYEPKTIEDVDIDNKTKKFYCTMRNCQKSHRKALGSYWQKHKMWDSNNLSFLKVNQSPGIPNYLPEKYWESCNELEDMDLVELDTQNLESKNTFGTTWDNWDYYQESFITVVSETIFEPWKKWNYPETADEIKGPYTDDLMQTIKNNTHLYHNIFFSEKILKPIMNLHPFIVFSVPGFLGQLEQLGFKTFDDKKGEIYPHFHINEDYDHEKDEAKRLKLLFKELDKIRNTPIEVLKDWYRSFIPVLKHNQELFLSYGKKPTRKVRLLNKLRRN